MALPRIGYAIGAAALLVGGTASAVAVRRQPALVFDGSSTTYTPPGAYYRQTYSFGYPPLQASRCCLHLRSARAVDVPAGLVIEDISAANLCDGTHRAVALTGTGQASEEQPGLRLYDLVDVTVAPGRFCWYLIVTVHAERPGHYEVPAVDVTYDGAVPLRRSTGRVPHRIVLDASKPGPDPLYCRNLPGKAAPADAECASPVPARHWAPARDTMPAGAGGVVAC